MDELENEIWIDHRKDNNPPKPRNLKESLEMLLEQAKLCADYWSNVNVRVNDRRSFPAFLHLLEISGLDWHKYAVSEDNGINEPNRWTYLQAPSYNVLHLHPELTSDPNWVMANKFYSKTLSLMRLLERIRTSSSNEFSRKEAELLEAFLGHLIMIQQEQRVVEYSFCQHLEQLRNSLTFSSNAVDNDSDGDREKCPFLLSKHTLECDMWQQKHLFDSLYIITRELTWLLKKMGNSDFTSPSFIEESRKILEIIVVFISKFKKSKELLDQYLVDKCGTFTEDEMMQLVQENKEVLDNFANHIQDLENKCVGKGSITEEVLVFLGDMFKISMDDDEEMNSSSSSLGAEFTKAVEETKELIEEAGNKLKSDAFSTLAEAGSTLGSIALWRILFESSLVHVRLDLISKKHDEAINLGAKLLDSYPGLSYQVQTSLNMLHGKISKLLSDGDKVLFDFLAMHRTVAEITYMLGDAFTTGGAGMKALSGETSSPGISNKNDKEIEMDIQLDFPWDKHNLDEEIEIDLDDPDMALVNVHGGDNYRPHDDDDFI